MTDDESDAHLCGIAYSLTRTRVHYMSRRVSLPTSRTTVSISLSKRFLIAVQSAYCGLVKEMAAGQVADTKTICTRITDEADASKGLEPKLEMVKP